MAFIFLGTGGADLFTDPDTQDGGSNIISGLAGDDTLEGVAGNDTIYAGTGSDSVLGGSGNDVLWGDFNTDTGAGGVAGNDYLSGGDGNDQILGEGGSDTLVGGAGDDVLRGQGSGADDAAADFLYGGDGADTLWGSAGNDVQHGEGDADWVMGEAGADFLTGGLGPDTLDGQAGNDTLAGDEDNDALYGGDGADFLSGDTGNDFLSGDFSPFEGPGTGNDTLDGGDGDDTLHGGAAVDSLIGGIGADRLDAGAGNDVMYGGGGNDTLYAGGGADSLFGGDGADELWGDFSGTDGPASGNDTLDGGGGGDFLYGELGDDTYIVDDLNVTIVDSGGEDTAIVSVSGYKIPGSVENVIYTNGAERLPYYIDALYSGDRWGLFGVPQTISYGFLTEATVWAGQFGANPATFQPMDGGQQAEVASLLDLYETFIDVTFVPYGGDPADADLSFGMNDQPSSSGYAMYPEVGDVYIDIDSFGFSVLIHEIGHALGLKHPFEGTPVLTGAEDSKQYTVMSYTGRTDSTFMDVTDLGGGNYSFDYPVVRPDTLMLYDIASLQHVYGVNTATGAGDDTYTFAVDEPFFRTLWDGGGNDTISVANFSAGSIIDLREGHFSSIRVLPDPYPPGWSGTTPTYTGTDNLSIAYGAVIENAVGGSGSDILLGNDVGNVLDGGAGDDRLDGGAGADSLVGGTGNDTYVVDDAGDLVTETAGEGADMVRVALSGYTLPGAVETLVFTGVGSASGVGNALANILSGSNGGDTLDGGAGSDIIAGGPGNDTYVLDNSGDMVMELPNSGADLVQSTVSYSLMQAWHVENLTLTGGGNVNGSGNWLNNVIVGSSGANVLDGNNGNDTLDGAGGNDTLIGGAGDDVLVYDAADGSVQGGAGTDTLRFEGGGINLDLTVVANSVIRDVEIVDITGAGNNSLTLTMQDVIDLSSTTDVLRVDGDNGDAVTSAGQGWAAGGTTTFGPTTYNVYNHLTHQLLVDQEILSQTIS